MLLVILYVHPCSKWLQSGRPSTLVGVIPCCSRNTAVLLGRKEDVVTCCKLALAANTDRYTDRLMVVQTEHVQYPNECKDTCCTWTIRRLSLIHI